MLRPPLGSFSTQQELLPGAEWLPVVPPCNVSAEKVCTPKAAHPKGSQVELAVKSSFCQ